MDTRERFSEIVNVSASARLIYQLGEQLISDEFVALAELIKNAYDADCTWVRVIVDTKAVTEHGLGRIVIEDNGNGMTKSILQNAFLRISTSFKKREKYSPHFERRTLGEKGLGRLSFQRLGNYIYVSTTPRLERLKKIVPSQDVEFAEQYNSYLLTMNWRDFENSEQDLQNITASCEYVNEEHPIYGTKIVIEGIRNINFWELSRAKETQIRTEINGMVNPFMQNSKQRFRISLEIDGKKFSNHKIDEVTLGLISDVKVVASFKDWVINMTIFYKSRYQQRLLDDAIARMKNKGFDDHSLLGEYDEYIEEHVIDLKNQEFTNSYPYLKGNKLQNIFSTKTNGGEWAYPGDFEVVLYALDQAPTTYQELIGVLSGVGIVFNTQKEVKAIWDAAVGVYLFRNDFRILPYGPSLDWLYFTKRSQRGKANIYKSHTVSGYVQLDSKTSENLTEQTNRLGLIEDEFGVNFFTLVRDTVAVVAFQSDVKIRSNFEVKVGSENDQESVRTKDGKVEFKRVIVEEEEKYEALKHAQVEIQQLTARLPKDPIVTQSVERIVANIQKLEKVDQKIATKHLQEKHAYEEKIATLQSLVGLAGQGIIVEALTHELHRIEVNISEYAKQSKGIIHLLAKGQGENRQLLDVQTYQERILQEVLFLQQQLEHLEPTYRRNRLQLDSFNLRAFLHEVYRDKGPMVQRAVDQQVDVKITGDDFQVQANKGLLITVFDNIFLNSLYWLNGRENKQIVFEICSEQRELIVWDSGPGVHSDICNSLFEPYQSMKPEGRGLGLYIVKELVRSLQGDIALDLSSRNDSGNNYKFVIHFPNIV